MAAPAAGNQGGAAQEAPRVHLGTQSFVQSIKRTSDRNMKIINEECDGQTELQGVVLGVIEDWKAAQAAATSAGTTVCDAILQEQTDRKKRRKSAGGGGEAVEAKEMAIENVELRRGQLKFATWTDKLKKTLLEYLEPDVFDFQTLKNMSRDTQKESIEFALDLRLHGDKTDNVGTKWQRDLFVSLDRAYLRCGRRLQHITFTNGRIDWPAVGHFSHEETGENEEMVIDIYCKLTSTTVRIPQALLLGHTGPFRIVGNFSIHMASLTCDSMDAADTPVKLKNLFPQLRRTLMPRPSETEGAAGPEGAGEAEGPEDDDAAAGAAAAGGPPVEPPAKAGGAAGGVSAAVPKTPAAVPKSPAGAAASPVQPPPKAAGAAGGSPVAPKAKTAAAKAKAAAPPSVPVSGAPPSPED